LNGAEGLAAAIRFFWPRFQEIEFAPEKAVLRQNASFLGSGRSGFHCEGDHSAAPGPRVLTFAGVSFGAPQLTRFCYRLPHMAAPTTNAAAMATFHCNGWPVVTNSKMVERIGVAKASKPMRRVSPSLMAASHRKNAPPKGPSPNTAISRMSSVLKDTEGSSHIWQAKDKSPDAAAKLPTAAVGKLGSRRVINE